MARLGHTLRDFLRRALELPDRRAEEHSMQLLLNYLSPAQRQQFARHRYFEVIGGETGRRYRIRRGSIVNVEQLDGVGRCVSRLCFVPEGQLPVGDVMLAQKMALELYEFDALSVANRGYRVLTEDPSVSERLRR
jgi:hypothetical protein